MSVVVKKYTKDFSDQYESFLKKCDKSMFTHSLKYRNFLIQNLAKSEDHYFCLFENDKLTAVLPTFIMKGPNGNIINSLPFYGSHGGVLSTVSTNPGYLKILLNSLLDLASNLNVFSCVVIDSPLSPNKSIKRLIGSNFSDERIGQITCLPKFEDNLDTSLMKIFHKKTRNMVRKGLKQNFSVCIDNSSEALKALHSIHSDNMLRLNGIAKPLSVFESIPKIFNPYKDYNLYLAKSDGKIISGLLLFYFKDKVEYFTPATLPEFQNKQPLSQLIFTAMLDAIRNHNSRYWNWGGTWKSQSGVYNFKRRWGADDYYYKYHIKHMSDNVIGDISEKSLINDYPFFYTIPFSELIK